MQLSPVPDQSVQEKHCLIAVAQGEICALVRMMRSHLPPNPRWPLWLREAYAPFSG